MRPSPRAALGVVSIALLLGVGRRRRRTLRFLRAAIPVGVCFAVGWAAGCGSGAAHEVPVTVDAGADVAPDVPHCPTREPAVHRASAKDCSPSISPACVTDADCKTQVMVESGLATYSGACVSKSDGKQCDYNACIRDSDCAGITDVCTCPTEFLPAPQPIGSACVHSTCRVDADCGDGKYCSPSYYASCHSFGFDGYYCHTCDDRCLDDTDCAWHCLYDPAVGHWACLDGVTCTG